jgi:regulatory protein
VVTALRATRRGRVALHIDGSFVCSVSDAFIARWRLFKGRELDDETLAQMCRQASAERVLTDAYRLLAQRSRARVELRQRLLLKGHDEAAVADALEKLVADRLLDDAAFARSYVADKRGLSLWGSERIRHGLAQLGVEQAVIDTALGEAGAGESDDVELERALAVLRRRGGRQESPAVARRRAYQLLVRRGFSSPVAYAAIRRWSGEATESSEEG